ncbi:pheA operon leader peptide PheL [Salmonella enterica subsp. enterica]|nr:pheA operon leader peptide PheL [Salmonella enterica subsp. enterica]
MKLTRFFFAFFYLP